MTSSAAVLAAACAMVAISTVVAAVDLIRQPTWAWKTAGEPKAGCLLLVLLLPGVGPAIYVFGARPKVVATVALGRAANLPFERFGDHQDHSADDTADMTPTTLPDLIASISEPERADPTPATRFRIAGSSRRKTTTLNDANADRDPALAEDQEVQEASQRTGLAAPVAAGSQTPATDTAAPGLRFPGGAGRPYRPRQRTSFDESESLASVAAQILSATQEVADQISSSRRVRTIGTLEETDGGVTTAPAMGLPLMAAAHPAPFPSAIGRPAIGRPAPVYSGTTQTTQGDVTPARGSVMVEDRPTVVVAAQWMEDPTSRHDYRYWDGAAWTECVSDGTIESRDPVLD